MLEFYLEETPRPYHFCFQKWVGLYLLYGTILQIYKARLSNLHHHGIVT